MNEEARKIWKTPAGHSLFAAIFDRRPLTPQQQATADQLKRVDPPKLAKQPPRPPPSPDTDSRAVPNLPLASPRDDQRDWNMQYPTTKRASFAG